MSNKTKLVFITFSAIFVMSCNSSKAQHSHLHGEHSHSHDNSQDYFSNYTIEDKVYGTKTIVKTKGDKRVITTNALPNHKTGDFPNQGNPNTISEQNRTYSLPLHPKYTGKAQWVREPGIALNGVKFEPGTAEVIVCDTGENYRVEALQETIDLGLDFNHAHVQPTGAYHYHGTPTSLVELFDTGEDVVHIGFAMDGFPIYYSKSGQYKSSYKLLDGNREGEDCTYENPKQQMDISVNGHHDGMFGSDFEYIKGQGDLDECNGITINGNYMYFVTEEFPYVSRCLMGEFTAERRPRQREQDREGGERGRPNNQAESGRGQGNQRGQYQGPPSFSELLQIMDENNDKKLSKDEVKGPLSNMFKDVDANKDGFITEEELKNAPRPQNGRPTRGR